MSDLTFILVIESKRSRDKELKCKGCHETGVVPRKGDVRRIRVHDRGTSDGHPRLLGVPRRVERLGRGVQQQDPLADQAGVRLPRLQVLQAEDLRPAEPEVPGQRLLTPILLGSRTNDGEALRSGAVSRCLPSGNPYCVKFLGSIPTTCHSSRT